MAHKFTFTVEVEVERTSGKFATRDEMADTIREWIEGADEGSLSGIGPDGDSEYETTGWTVDES